MDFLEDYAFVLKHRRGVENKAVDASCRRVCTLQSMSSGDMI